MRNEMTETKKHWFRKYNRLLQVEDRLVNKLKELDQRIQGIRSPNYSGMPRGGTAVTIVDLLADKESLENRIKRIHSKVIKCKREILDVIDTIENPTHAYIMEAHFIQLESMEDIAQSLNYTTTYVYRLFSKAIDLVDIPTIMDPNGNA